jgi:hypothetical protein
VVVDGRNRAGIGFVGIGDRRGRQLRTDLDGGGETLGHQEVDQDAGAVVEGGDRRLIGHIVAGRSAGCRRFRHRRDDLRRSSASSASQRQLGTSQHHSASVTATGVAALCAAAI